MRSVDDAGVNTPSGQDDPHPAVVELSEILSGTWNVEGPDISGRAEYRMSQRGCLVAYVDFQVAGSKMRVIQHIAYDPDRRTLQARYIDTMGGEATYTWVIEGRTIRVSLGEVDSATYFEATLNEDRSQYVGAWHYPDVDPAEQTETIVYTRVADAE